MGRGRQKAKQTKVARQLKYSSPDTDYDALARELHGDSAKSPVSATTDGVGDEAEDDDDPLVRGSGSSDDADDGWVGQRQRQ